MNKEENFKEKFKQALRSTIKVISDDYKPNFDKKNESSKNLNFFELDNLNNKHDFVRLRAEADSEALKKKFSNKKIYQKYLPDNSSYKSLYDIAEKIRYEILGSKMLRGISKTVNGPIEILFVNAHKVIMIDIRKMIFTFLLFSI